MKIFFLDKVSMNKALYKLSMAIIASMSISLILVPQGFNMGPLLFINNIYTKYLLYTDDLKLYQNVRTKLDSLFT